MNAVAEVIRDCFLGRSVGSSGSISLHFSVSVSLSLEWRSQLCKIFRPFSSAVTSLWFSASVAAKSNEVAPASLK